LCLKTQVIRTSSRRRLLSRLCSTSDKDERKVDEQDDEDDQDAEAAEDGEEEDDRSNHATVVANPAETTKHQREREALENDETNEPGEDEGEGGGDDRDERKKKRKPNTCTGKSEVNRRSLYQRKEDQETLPQALESELTFKLTCRRYAVSISEHLRAKQSQ